MLGYTALGGVLMSKLEPWSFLSSFYYSFITMTTVGFGDLIPKRDSYLYLVLLYIVIGLAITTMCIDLVGVQYIHKIHYFGRKLQDAKSAFAIVGGKVVLVSELYGRMGRRRRDGRLEMLLGDRIHPHLVPFIPRDIRRIRYIDRDYGGVFPLGYGALYSPYPGDRESVSTSTSSMEFHSCRYCHMASRYGAAAAIMFPGQGNTQGNTANTTATATMNATNTLSTHLGTQTHTQTQTQTQTQTREGNTAGGR